MRRIHTSLTVLVSVALGAPPCAADGLVLWPSRIDAVEQAIWPASEGATAQGGRGRKEALALLPTLPRATLERWLPKLLGDSDPEVRLAAAAAAASRRLRSAGKLVVGWLSHRDVRLRRAAAELLRLAPYPPAWRELTRTLHDTDPNVRQAAVRALGALGRREATAALLGLLDDVDPDVRQAVLHALEQLGDPSAVVPLLGRVHEQRMEARLQAVKTLGRLGDPRAATALTVALADSSAEVRAAAAEALGRMSVTDAVWSLAARLSQERSEVVATQIVQALGRIGTAPAVEVLFRLVQQPHIPEEVLSEAIGRAGSSALASLSDCIVHPRSSRGAHVCLGALGHLDTSDAQGLAIRALDSTNLDPLLPLRALERVGNQEALPRVLERLRSQDERHRAAAIETAAGILTRTGPSGMVLDPVRAALDAALGRPAEQAALVRLLGLSGSPRAADMLVPLLGSEHSLEVRVAAVDSLGQLRAVSAGADMAALLSLESPSRLRWHTARALWRTPAGVAVPEMVESIGGAAPQLRGLLAVALGGSAAVGLVSPPRLASLIEGADGPTQDALVEALGRVPEGAGLEHLAGLAVSPSRALRAKVAESLANQPGSEPLLLTLLEDPAPPVQANAAWALGRAGGVAAIERLRVHAEAENLSVAANATAALASIGHRKGGVAVAALCQLLPAVDDYARANALAGLRLMPDAVSSAEACPSAVSEATWSIQEHPSPEVRLAAARFLQTQSESSAEARRALKRCASDDSSGKVAAVCTQAKRKRSPQEVEPAQPVAVAIANSSGGPPTPGAAFALVNPRGLIRAGLADRQGVVLQWSSSPRGELHLALPAPFVPQR